MDWDDTDRSWERGFSYPNTLDHPRGEGDVRCPGCDRYVSVYPRLQTFYHHERPANKVIDGIRVKKELCPYSGNTKDL